MKVLEFKPSISLDIDASTCVSSENFKIVTNGYYRVGISKIKIFWTEDIEVYFTQVYFRGDKISIEPLQTRLITEGYVDLVKELESLVDEAYNTFNIIPKEQHKFLKRIYGVEKVYQDKLLNDEQKVITNMFNVLRDFDKELYQRRKDICNKFYGFNFEGENLDKEIISKEEFEARYNLLKVKYPKLTSYLEQQK